MCCGVKSARRIDQDAGLLFDGPTSGSTATLEQTGGSGPSVPSWMKQPRVSDTLRGHAPLGPGGGHGEVPSRLARTLESFQRKAKHSAPAPNAALGVQRHLIPVLWHELGNASEPAQRGPA